MVERQRYRGNRGPQIACRPICTYESPRGFPRSVLIQSCSHASAPARRARRRALGLVPSVRDRDTMILDADADSNGPGSTSYLGPHAYFLTFFRIGCSTMHKSPPRLGVGGVGDAWPFMEVVVGTVRNTFVYHPAPRTRTCTAAALLETRALKNELGRPNSHVRRATHSCTLPLHYLRCTVPRG